MSKEQIRLIIIDSEKNILNDKQITTTYPSELNDIALFANGDIYGVGSVRDAQNTDGLVMKLDRNLNLICQDHYGDASNDSFASLALLHNSQIAAVGKHTLGGEDSNMWLVKLNDDCSLASRNKSTLSLHQELSTVLSQEIDAHAIKVTKDMVISIEESALYFDVGQYVLKPNQKEFLNILSSKLIPFVKKYHTIIDFVEINGHTSSEWSGVDFTTNYLNNAQLSLNRSYAVLSHIFKKQDKAMQEILASLFRGSGSSYKDKKMMDDKEDKEKSRRVTFKIVLKNK
jgi:outer membrane protein OmpA-like peptidoglycan-associated protein